MTMSRVALAIVFGTAFLGCGNGGSGSSPAGSGAPPAAAGGGKLVHHKVTRDECTFEFDAPEQLKPAEKEDGLSTMVHTASFEFAGFSGASMYGLEQLAGLSLMGTKDTVLVKETANNVNLVVTRSEKPPSEPNKFIGGHGEEAETGNRQLGCSYLCWGTKEKEAETVAMCKSVRIQYKAPPAK